MQVWLKTGFLLAAVVAAVVAVAVTWDELTVAMGRVASWHLLTAAGMSLGYVYLTMRCWRSIALDLGAQLPGSAGSQLFFVSQLGKYLPGGLWNVLAIGEMGRRWGIPRRSSFSAMLVFWLVSVLTGLTVGSVYLLASGTQLPPSVSWLVWPLPLVAVLLVPPVLRRLLATALRLARREPLTQDPSTPGLLKAVGWAALAWVPAGAQVWLLAQGLAPGAGTDYPASLGGYALAWTAGFLVVVAPAGAGVREVVLAGLLGATMSSGAVVALVLLSRALITVADVLLALQAELRGRSLQRSTGSEPPTRPS